MKISDINVASLLLKFFRFLVAGGLNAGITLAIYQLLLFMLNPQLAYCVTWIAGLAIVVIIYPSKVFGSSSVTNIQKLMIVCLYGFSFLLGLICIWGLSHALGGPRLAIFFVLILTTVINFVGMYLILASKVSSY